MSQVKEFISFAELAEHLNKQGSKEMQSINELNLKKLKEKPNSE